MSEHILLSIKTVLKIGPKRPAKTGPKRLTPRIGPKRPGTEKTQVTTRYL